MPRLSPEHKVRPSGHAGWRRASRAAPAAQASDARAEAPQGMARVRVRTRRQGPFSSDLVHATAAPAATSRPRK
eukprot:6479471-Lingulodinium_polyedra.AAC.1